MRITDCYLYILLEVIFLHLVKIIPGCEGAVCAVGLMIEVSYFISFI